MRALERFDMLDARQSGKVRPTSVTSALGLRSNAAHLYFLY